MDDEINESGILDAPEIIRNVRYGGFWIRVAASLLDFLILLPLIILQYYNVINLKSTLMALVIILVSTLYKPLLEGLYGATWGKNLMNLKVVNTDFNKIDFSEAIIRYSPFLFVNVISLIQTMMMFTSGALDDVDSFMEYSLLGQESSLNGINTIASIVLLVFVIVVAFDARKQGVHDKIAKTYVVYDDSVDEDY